MPTILADSFIASLAKLANDEQKQAQLTAFTLMREPDRPGLQVHRIDKSTDPNFWSVRVSRDIRIIVHKTGGSLMLAYVDHHDDAYVWAERRRIEAHPTTGRSRSSRCASGSRRLRFPSRPYRPNWPSTRRCQPLSRRSSIAWIRASSCPSACRRTGLPMWARPPRKPSLRLLPTCPRKRPVRSVLPQHHLSGHIKGGCNVPTQCAAPCGSLRSRAGAIWPD